MSSFNMSSMASIVYSSFRSPYENDGDDGYGSDTDDEHHEQATFIGLPVKLKKILKNFYSDSTISSLSDQQRVPMNSFASNIDNPVFIKLDFATPLTTSSLTDSPTSSSSLSLSDTSSAYTRASSSSASTASSSSAAALPQTMKFKFKSSEHNGSNFINKMIDNAQGGRVCKVIVQNIQTSKTLGKGAYGEAKKANFVDLDKKTLAKFNFPPGDFVVKYQNIEGRIMNASDDIKGHLDAINDKFLADPHYRYSKPMSLKQYKDLFTYGGKVYIPINTDTSALNEDTFLQLSESCSHPSNKTWFHVDDRSRTKYFTTNASDIICASAQFMEYIMTQVSSELARDQSNHTSPVFIESMNVVFCSDKTEKLAGFYTLMPFIDSGNFYDITSSDKFRDMFVIDDTPRNYQRCRTIDEMKDDVQKMQTPDEFKRGISIEYDDPAYSYQPKCKSISVKREYLNTWNNNIEWIVTAIVHGVYVMQQHGIIHNDLKTDNIFLHSLPPSTKDFELKWGGRTMTFKTNDIICVPKIGDWGLACKYNTSPNSKDVQILNTSVINGGYKNYVINYFHPASDLAFFFFAIYGCSKLFANFSYFFSICLEVNSINVDSFDTESAKKYVATENIAWVRYHEKELASLYDDYELIRKNELVLTAAEYVYSYARRQLEATPDYATYVFFDAYLKNERENGMSPIKERILRLQFIIEDAHLDSKRLNTDHFSSLFDSITPEGCLEAIANYRSSISSQDKHNNFKKTRGKVISSFL